MDSESSSLRAAIHLFKIVRRTKKAIKGERRRPLEDRRAFIMRCSNRGVISVTFYDSLDEYRRVFDEARDEPGVVWCTGYDPYEDGRR